VAKKIHTRTIFDKLYRCMRRGAVLVTYCAKGEVKRNLRAGGFVLENLPGPPGKREITRARKP
jgi:tRNA U34 5-methylaminomethyl-2-thiouridine-forming methyltransferase MnmC